ncbi:MAG: 4-(cytidine 5'-diphospho)-2-C-methyl-D-erythritol kinase [Arenicella sp.]|nr:4-(cytidine 5'-diphospho)-2-C-methyl-D-erythritol kinase [Arenicella sp.]
MSEVSYSAKGAWPAPAKINLFLHIVGKRSDGYHNLQTVFQFIDYGGDLYFELNCQGRISRHYDLGFSEEVDLCMRAAILLKEYADPDCGVEIGLTKRLPMGGGLGGGSSDAATVLIALNSLWNVGLSRQKLAEIGLLLGADVPVFVMGRSAWAEGVGEQLTPLELPETWFLVLNPQISVSTAQIFSNKRLTATPEMKKIRALEKGIDSSFGENQLESIVRAEYPQVNSLIEWLSQYGQPRMSGSGGSVFMPVPNQQQGLEILAKRPSYSVGFVAKGLNIHPLLNIV